MEEMHGGGSQREPGTAFVRRRQTGGTSTQRRDRKLPLQGERRRVHPGSGRDQRGNTAACQSPCKNSADDGHRPCIRRGPGIHAGQEYFPRLGIQHELHTCERRRDPDRKAAGESEDSCVCLPAEPVSYGRPHADQPQAQAS